MRRLTCSENAAVDNFCSSELGWNTIVSIQKAAKETILSGASKCIREALVDNDLDIVKAASNRDFVLSVLFIASYSASPEYIEDFKKLKGESDSVSVAHTSIDKDIELN